jgi:hypothetical protein
MKERVPSPCVLKGILCSLRAHALFVFSVHTFTRTCRLMTLWTSTIQEARENDQVEIDWYLPATEETSERVAVDLACQGSFAHTYDPLRISSNPKGVSASGNIRTILTFKCTHWLTTWYVRILKKNRVEHVPPAQHTAVQALQESVWRFLKLRVLVRALTLWSAQFIWPRWQVCGAHYVYIRKILYIYIDTI